MTPKIRPIGLPPRLAKEATGDEPRILFLDLASKFGYAFGIPGHKPISGSLYFTHNGRPLKDGVTPDMPRTFANVQRFTEAVYELYQPTVVGYEAPVPAHAMKGRTNANTFDILHGIPANMTGTMYRYGIHHFHVPTVKMIRHFFLDGNTKKMDGKQEKEAVFRKCVALEWIDVVNELDNARDRSDALAGWSWLETFLAPRKANHIDRWTVMAKNPQAGRLL